MDQFRIVTDPVADSVAVSAIFAVLPLLTLFVLLGALRMRAWLAGLISLAVALVVAIAVYAMPVGQAVLSATEGAAFGFFPILWIVLNAIWVYNLTVESGHFDVLRRSMARVSPDMRIQAIIVAFCFGALLEALAGFGTPVAVTVVMLMALGFPPVRAAAVALIANTAPVAFGALATPIVTLGTVTSGAADDPRLNTDTLGAMVGRQTPILAVIVPLVLVAVIDGRRGVRQTWPAAAVAGIVFAVGQFLASNYVSVPLTDIIAALAAAAAVVLLLRVWQPAESPPLHAEAATIGGARASEDGDSVAVLAGPAHRTRVTGSNEDGSGGPARRTLGTESEDGGGGDLADTGPGRRGPGAESADGQNVAGGSGRRGLGTESEDGGGGDLADTGPGRRGPGAESADGQNVAGGSGRRGLGVESEDGGDLPDTSASRRGQGAAGEDLAAGSGRRGLGTENVNGEDLAAGSGLGGLGTESEDGGGGDLAGRGADAPRARRSVGADSQGRRNGDLVLAPVGGGLAADSGSGAAGPGGGEAGPGGGADGRRDSAAEVARAYSPYLIIIAIFSVANIGVIKSALAKEPWTVVFAWPGLHVLGSNGKPVSSTNFTLGWLPAAGTLMILAGILTAIVLRVGAGRAVRAYGHTYVSLRHAIVTVMAVLALAYVLNQSGQTSTLGAFLAAAGGFFVFLSSILGWIGVAVTGSDTSANALFGALQVQTAAKAGLDPVLLAAANSSGGVLGKMVSPQNLAIAASAVGMPGREGDIFRKVVGWSALLLLIMCVLVTLQGTPVLDWMIPR